MKKVAPLLILVVACGCDRDAVSRRSANTEKADASGLPTIVVKGELTGTYSKALFRNGVPEPSGRVRYENQFTLRKNGSIAWTRTTIIQSEDRDERWANSTYEYFGEGRWTTEGTLLTLKGKEKFGLEESKPRKGVPFTLQLRIRDKIPAFYGDTPQVVYQKITDGTQNVR